jgi:hypothetical protein
LEGLKEARTDDGETVSVDEEIEGVIKAEALKSSEA